MVVFCQVHFLRGVDEVVRKAGFPAGAHGLMMAILYAESQDAYIEALDYITDGKYYKGSNKALIIDYSIAFDSDDIKHWASHKKQDWVAQGLNMHYSPMSSVVFGQLRKHTNAVESSHHKANASGKQVTLLQALLRYLLIMALVKHLLYANICNSGMEVDRKDIYAHNDFTRHGVRHSYRATGVTQNMQKYHARAAQRSQTSRNLIRSGSIFTGQASTSGVPRRSQSQRSTPVRRSSRR
jgi:hypothetical protein